MLQMDASRISKNLRFQAPVNFQTAVHRMAAWELGRLGDVNPEDFDEAADDRFLAAKMVNSR